MVQAFLFYTLAIILVGSAVMTILSSNSIRSSLFLLLAILNVSGLLVLLGAKVIALALILLTVFTIAVLFLFGVLMLDINVVRLHRVFKQHLWLVSIIGLIFGLVLVAFLMILLLLDVPETAIIPEQNSNGLILGPALYTSYFYIAQACGLILLVSVVGVVILTARKRDLNKEDAEEHKPQQLELPARRRSDEVGPC